MAIVHSLAIGKAKGSMGDITYTTVGGATISKQKIFNPKLPRTYYQMIRRVQWANIVNLWQLFENRDKPSFENKNARVSDFNMFIAKNLGIPVYLTKEQAGQGATVVAPYVITEGSLPTIAIDATLGGVPFSDINLSSLVIEEDTTLADFSQAVVNNNESYEYGDLITAFLLTQSINSVTGNPYATIKSWQVQLNGDDNDTLLSDIVTPDMFSITDGMLSAATSVQGGLAWVHSRRTSSGTLVSTQSIFTSNNILANYQTTTIRNAAIESYGGKLTRDYLTPEYQPWTAAA